ncbi:SxtJ family membrane protein [Eoetvoesiella caeni]|uniref:SxtJ family membrane protein n=1 Tax=Eoetvoesiella caeni TaxID=645616 RepID=UPI0011BE916D|nr:SxtJ family membrane protein [Eoetvoesiella caeni]MCI2807811.1 SxtJ family membrane protein [Eoetvoesiella caeni]NYT54186.1 hypothetical protein [Eoetvoesiella caeni]
MNLSKQDKLPSNRSFGALFTAIFAAIAIYSHITGAQQHVWLSWAFICVLLGLITLLAPKLLLPFNKIWFLIGVSLAKIFNPLVLGVLFFIVLTPVALVAKVFGRDALRLKRREIPSYWIERCPPGPSPETFKNQF